MKKPLFLLALMAGASLCAAQSVGRTFYVDCSAAANGTGTSAGSPWNSLAPVNAQQFQPGDTIALRRGTTCRDALAPRGSGSDGHPVRLTAWGVGPRPKVIAPRSADAVLRLFNQEYWDIDSLDLSGSRTWGVYISGDRGVLHHIHLTDLAVHDVMGGKIRHKESGLVTITPSSAKEHFDGVLVDDVTAWDSNQWVGILIGGGDLGYPPESDWSENAEIRNSTVHDVQGDGIVLFRVRHGRIDSSVAWNTGMQDTQTVGTPNAIWTWMCDDCTVENNEAYLTDSPGVDGGAYDIDYGNTKNSVIDNYAHDTQGYCIAVFGAGFVTRQSLVRGNLCIDNARSPRMAKYQGALFVLTWNGGSIDGLTIENNIVYWDPVENAPALLNEADIAPGTAVFRNNTIESTAAWMLSSNPTLALSQNSYRYYSDQAGAPLPEWRIGKTSVHSLSAMDAMRNPVTPRAAGSYAQRSLTLWPLASRWPANDRSASPRPRTPQKPWSLRCDLPVTINTQGGIDDEALQQIVVLKSFARQYRPLGLEVTLNLTAPETSTFSTPAFRNVLTDLDLQGITVRTSGPRDPQTVLSGPGEKVSNRWRRFAGPVQLGLALRKALGQPLFSQTSDTGND